MSHSLGRDHVALLLTQTELEVSCVLLRHGREVDRHTWDGDSGSPELLADALGHQPDQVADVLAVSGPPRQVLEQTIRLLGLPPQTADLFTDRAAEHGEYVNTTGLLAGMRATARGDFDPPAAEDQGLVGRWNRLAEVRPPWYRAVNATAAIILGVLTWLLASRIDGDLFSWTGLVAALVAVMAAGCLWDARPSRGTGEDGESTAKAEASGPHGGTDNASSA